MVQTIWRALAIAVALMAATAAHAGGHLDVDDAGTMDPGQCLYETWAGHSTQPSVDYFHLGPACRVGPVELGLTYDYFGGDNNRLDLVGPQLKWTFFGQAPDAVLAAALSFSTFHDVRNGGNWGGQAVVPVTWQVNTPLAISLNLGYDWLPGSGDRSGRGGLGMEWAFNPTWSLLAEHSRAFGLWTTRAGFRYSFTPLISLDVTAAHIGTNGTNAFTVGLNHTFNR